jgi:hypothetical protein
MKSAAELEAEIKRLRKQNRDLINSLDERTRELDAQRRENARLREQAEQPVKTDPLFIPKHIETDGSRWTIRRKKVGKYSYYYAYKRIKGILHSVSLGCDFDAVAAVRRVRGYMRKIV